MAGALAVAKKKKAKASRPVAREDYIRMRMTPEFKAWLEGLAATLQLTMTDTIVQALMRLAKDQGHQPPPRR